MSKNRKSTINGKHCDYLIKDAEYKKIHKCYLFCFKVYSINIIY